MELNGRPSTSLHAATTQPPDAETPRRSHWCDHGWWTMGHHSTSAPASLPGRRETDPSRARLGQFPENQSEDAVSPCCLDERFVIPEKGWHAGFPAPRVEAVDEVTQWIQGQVLA